MRRLILMALIAGIRDLGYIDDAGANERVLSYEMYSDWRYSSNHHPDRPLSGLSFLLGNYTPGKVAMKRGKLSSTQTAPQRFTYVVNWFCAHSKQMTLLLPLKISASVLEAVSQVGLRSSHDLLQAYISLKSAEAIFGLMKSPII